MLKSAIKILISKERLHKIRAIVSRYFGHNKIHIAKGSKVEFGDPILKGCVVDIRGKNCRVKIGSGNILINCKIRTFSNGCDISIGKNCFFNDVTFWLEDEGSAIVIGNDVKMTGKIQMGVVEGTKLTIGNDCLFSSDIHITTMDSHSIFDEYTGERINPSKDVCIGNHVWVGRGVGIGKGVMIGDNNVIGAASYVSKSVNETNTIIAGAPARVIKKGINWGHDR